MLKVIRTGDRMVPLVCCNVCEKWIDGVEFGAAVFCNPVNKGDTQEVQLVHRGVCHESAEATLRAVGETPHWQELKRYLMDGLYNSGLALKEVHQIPADHDRSGHL